MPQKRKSKAPLIILVAAVLVVGLGVLLFFLLFARNPKQQLRHAFDKTINTIFEEQQATSSALGFSTVMQAIGDGPVLADVAVRTDIPGMQGQLSMEASVESDIEARKVAATVGIGLGGTTLLDGTIEVDDDIMVLSVPSLFSGRYSVHTSTLGKDFNNSIFADPSFAGTMASFGYGYTVPDVDPSFGFNLFDAYLDEMQNAPSTLPATDAANTRYTLDPALWDNATVAAAGKAKTTVNGNSGEYSSYTVTFPEKPLENYLADTIHAMLEDGSLAPALAALNGLDSLDEIEDPEELAEDLIDDIKDAIHGDVTFTAYVDADGFLVKLESEEELQLVLEFGSKQGIGSAFGLVLEGEDFSLQCTLGGYTLTKDGVLDMDFSLMYYDGYSSTEMDGTVYYNTQKAADNFSATISINDGQVECRTEGTLEVDTAKNRIYADLYDLTLDSYGSVVELSLEMSVQPSQGISIDTASATPFFEMDLLRLADLALEVQANLEKLQASPAFSML